MTERQRLADAREKEQGVVALVRGEAVAELPADLYIPPDALEVFLEAFEGPLDLLLYLIRRHNLDILDIQVAEITDQYLRYIDLMESLKLDLAGEYLLMAAMLAEIKSRLLLPKPAAEETQEEDPRAELVRRLQEYEQLRHSAQTLDGLPRMERDFFAARAARPAAAARKAQPRVDMRELALALAALLHRAELGGRHAVQLEGVSVRARMSEVLSRLGRAPGSIPFAALFDIEEGRAGVLATFLAILELAREALVEINQSEAFAPIFVRRAGAADGDRER